MSEAEVRQVRHKAIRDGAYVMSAKQYEALKQGDVIFFAESSGGEKHNAVMLAGIHITHFTHKP